MMDKCKKCAFKFGTLACCTTVSNEWITERIKSDKYKDFVMNEIRSGRGLPPIKEREG